MEFLSPVAARNITSPNPITFANAFSLQSDNSGFNLSFNNSPMYTFGFKENYNLELRDKNNNLISFLVNKIRYEVLITVPTTYSNNTDTFPFCLYIPGWNDQSNNVYSSSSFYDFILSEPPFSYTSRASSSFNLYPKFTNFIWACINIYTDDSKEYITGDLYHINLQTIIPHFMSQVVSKLKYNQCSLVGKSFGAMSIIYNIPSCCFYQFSKIVLFSPGFLVNNSTFPLFFTENNVAFTQSSLKNNFDSFFYEKTNMMNILCISSQNDEVFTYSTNTALFQYLNSKVGSSRFFKLLTLDSGDHASGWTIHFHTLSQFVYNDKIIDVLDFLND